MPTPHIPDDRISNPAKLAQFATELTDYEVKQIGRIVGQLVMKYGRKANTPENLEALRDEALTRLADELNILATLDPAPCFYGEPPTLEIVGKVPTDDLHKYGFDHERKQHEVLEANKRNEAFRGQKEGYGG
jgi:hypothetical protein